jgi:hypothetical protein
MNSRKEFLIGMVFFVLLIVGGVAISNKISDQNKKNEELQKQLSAQSLPKVSVNGYTFYKQSDPALVVFEALLALDDPRVNQVLKDFDIKIIDLDKKQQFPVEVATKPVGPVLEKPTVKPSTLRK